MKKFLSIFVMIAVMVAVFPAVASAYVGNSNTRKFHREGCHFVAKMNPKNRVSFGSRDEAMRSGYVPCKRCKP